MHLMVSNLFHHRENDKKFRVENVRWNIFTIFNI